MVEDIPKKNVKKKKKNKYKIKLNKSEIFVLAGGFILFTKFCIDAAHENKYEEPASIPTSMVDIIDNDNTSTIKNHISDGTLKEVSFVEGAVSVYEILNELNLDKYDKKLDRVDVSNIDEKTINLLISKYEKLKKGDIKTPSKDADEFYKIVNILISYRDSLTKERLISSIDEVLELSNVVLTSNIYDALPYGRNYDSINTNLYDYSSSKLNISYDSEISYELSAGYFCNLKYFANEVRKLSKMKDDFEKVDNGIIVKQERKVIDYIKTCICVDYYVEDGSIHQIQKNNDIKQKVKKSETF